MRTRLYSHLELNEKDLESSSLIIKSLSFRDRNGALRHAQNLIRFLERSKNPEASQLSEASDSPSIVETIKYFGLPFEIGGGPEAYETYEDYYIVTNLDSITLQRHNRDFFDLLRELNDTFDELKRNLRSLNDSSGEKAEFAAVSAYLSSFQAFVAELDQEDEVEVPTALYTGLLARLSRLLTSGTTDALRKLAETALKVIDRL